MNHPLAHSPTITDSLKEWLSTFPDLHQQVSIIQLSNLHTILPRLMHSIDHDFFPDSSTNQQIINLMEEWFNEKTLGTIQFDPSQI